MCVLYKDNPEVHLRQYTLSTIFLKFVLKENCKIAI